MARVKLSEYRSKHLIYAALNKDYAGIEVHLAQLNQDMVIDDGKKYVVKVDQAVKKRNKLGLVSVNRTKEQVYEDLEIMKDEDYSYALVEPYIEHSQESEHYVLLQLLESGVELRYSNNGGVDIESHADSIESALLSEEEYREEDNTTSAPSRLVSALYEVFQKSHMTYLEINPCVIDHDDYLPLDAAVEVDGSAQFFVGDDWSSNDIRSPKSAMNEAEKTVDMLASKSPASLSLKVLNPDGSIFLLLSGGGASVVVADEIANLGHLADIANYGEYSGNPNEEETYLYTCAVLDLLLSSKAANKVLLIAGGVANFTDVAKTFKGIMRAIEDVSEQIVAQSVSIYVRRGGPNQKRGLDDMRQFLDSKSIKNNVHGPDASLALIVREAVEGLNG